MHCQVPQPPSFNWVPWFLKTSIFHPQVRIKHPLLFCCVLSTVGSDMTIVLWKNRCSHSKNQFDERKQDWLEEKFGLWRLKKLDTVQAEPLFPLPNQEEDKRTLCSQGAGLEKVQSCRLGQADFLPRQRTFKFTCPKGKGLSKSSSN